MAKLNILSLLVLTSSLFGLPIGNPSEPVLLSTTDQMSLRVGYFNDTVSTTPLVADDWSQEAKWMTNSAQITLNMLGKVDLYATLGVGTLRTRPDTLQMVLPQNGNANACLSIRTFPSAAYGYGIRATVLQLAGVYLGVEGQIMQSSPRPFFSTAMKEEKHPENSSMNFKQRQCGLAASYTIPMKVLVIPYAGVRWRQVTLDFGDLTPPKALGGEFRSLKEESPWGSVLGAALIGRHCWSVAAEGSLRTQRSFSLSAQVKY